MRINDLLYFLRQIFFPNWQGETKGGAEEEAQDDEPGRLTLWLEFVWKKLRSGRWIGAATSLLVHAVFLLILSWLILPIPIWNNVEIFIRGDNLPRGINVPGDEISINPGFENGNDKPAPGEANEEKIVAMTDPTTEPESSSTVAAAPDNSRDTSNQGAAIPISDNGTVAVGEAQKPGRGEFVPGGGLDGRGPKGRGGSIGSGETT